MVIVDAEKFCDYVKKELEKDIPNIKAVKYTHNLDLLEVFVPTQFSTLCYVLGITNAMAQLRSGKFSNQKELIDELKWQYKCRVNEIKNDVSNLCGVKRLKTTIIDQYCTKIKSALEKRVGGCVNVSKLEEKASDDDAVLRVYIDVNAYIAWTGTITNFMTKALKENYSIDHFAEDVLRDYETDLDNISYEETKEDFYDRLQKS